MTLAVYSLLITNDENMNQGMYFVIASVILAVGLIGAALIFSGNLGGPAQVGGDATNNNNNNNDTISVDVKDVDTENEPFIGSLEAPLTMAYWYDYQCPFCKRFEEQTLPLLKEKYVDQGNLRIVFKDFAFLGPDSQSAGLVSNAVWDQVKDTSPQLWWEFQKAMFKHQDAENGGWGSKQDILALLDDIAGLDRAAVEQALNQNEQQYQQELNADRQEGQRFGVRGTPGFILEDQAIAGAQPTQVFEQVIEQYLNQ